MAIKFERTITVTIDGTEENVLRCIARGMSDKEIAAKLRMPPRTVKYWNQRLHLKLGQESGSPRSMLIIWAYENGIVKPGVQDAV